MIRLCPAPSLADLTTLKVGGTALAEIRLETTPDFDALPAALERIGGAPLVLGGGSNVLAAEGALPVTIIRPLMGAKEEPRIVAEQRRTVSLPPNEAGSRAESRQEETVRIRVGAGLRMPTLLAWCAQRGLSGLEGLVGVPGRVGGAVAMNAGAYGCGMGPLLRRLTVFTPEDGVQTIDPEDWQADYRHFALRKTPAWFAVAEVELELTRRGSNTVRNAMVTHLEAKRRTQPITEHTAGCVFKNPPGLSAGKLLDNAGMRGRREGAMRFTEKHANFMAHDRGCTAANKQNAGNYTAAVALISEAREAVARQTGITLELEIKVWPCPLF